MPRRWATLTRAWVYRYLALRDGDYCQICQRSPTTPFGLDIDHLDCTKSHNEPENLRLLCRSCNVALENRSRPRPKCPRERENPKTRVHKQAIPYHEGSPEMQANALFEVRYRHWLQDFIAASGFITKREAVNAGAEVVGCNPTTAAKYLAKLTSLAGPLQETRDMLNEPVVTARDQSNGNACRPAGARARKETT